MGASEKIAKYANRLHSVTAVLCGFLLLIVFAAQVAVVVLRYAFAAGFLELQDTVAYAFAALVILSVPLALRTDRHVRVDVFREHQRPDTRLAIDRLAVIFLLLPLFGLTLYFALPNVLHSWEIGEASRETGGLPGYYLVKTALPAACVLMMVQGLALLAGAGYLKDPETHGR